MSEELMKKEEKKMTIDSHNRGSERRHNKRYEKKNAKADGKRLSQEEINKELAEIRKELDVLTMQLEENQRQGWVLRKKPVEWHEMQRRLQQKQVKWLREKLKEVELEMEESICEPEQGEIMGESEDYTEDKEWRTSEDLMDYWDSSKQHEEMLTEDEVLTEDEDLRTETSSEVKGLHGFKSENLCMFAGETCKEGKFVDIVIKEKEDK